MKLLFDQNISPKVVHQLIDVFPGSKQVRHLGLENASDSSIFDYAKENGFSIVTFDSDFLDLNIIRGIPPKIIWLRTGNLTTRSVAHLLNRNIKLVRTFLEPQQTDVGILEIVKRDCQ